MDNETTVQLIENLTINISDSHSVSHYYNEINNAQNTVIAVEITLVSIIVLGNIFVLALFWQERKYHNTSHKYIISMALSDLVQGLCSAPVVMYLSTGIKVGSEECLNALIIGSSAGITSLIIIFVTSVDRYWAIVHPVSYKTKSTAAIAKALITIGWITGLVMGLLIIPFQETPPNPDLPCYIYTERVNKTYALICSIGLVVPCNVLVAYFYYKIYKVIMDAMGKNTSYEAKFTNLGKIVLRRHTTRQSLNKAPNAGNAITNENNQNIGKDNMREIRTTIIIFITVILYLVCWIPGVFVLSLLLYDPYSITVNYMLASYILTHVNSAVDPFLYAFNIRGVDRAAIRLLRRMLCMKVELESNQSSINIAQSASRSSSRQSINKPISFT